MQRVLPLERFVVTLAGGRRQRRPGAAPWTVLAVLALLQGGPAAAAEPEPFDLAAQYTKYEHRVPMRDGVRLFTVVLAPKDSSRSHPILLWRTPYGAASRAGGKRHYGVDFLPEKLTPDMEALARAGYVLVFQETRGRFLSEGTFVDMQPQRVRRGPRDTDASTDTWDTVEWLLKHVPGHNGRVGLWGTSYPGFFAAAGIIDSHPAIKAAVPMAPVIDLFRGDDSYHNGAFMLAASFDFYSFFLRHEAPTTGPAREEPFDYRTTSGYDYFLGLGNLRAIAATLPPAGRETFEEELGHPTHDEYWKARDLAPRLRDVHCAVLWVGGWYDLEDPQGVLTAFHAVERQVPGADNALVMGPWAHAAWHWADGARLGHVRFGPPTARQFREQILLPFLERHLRGEPAAKGRSEAAPAKATVFETGTNVWRRFPAWPPPGLQPRTLYLQPGGGLAFVPPPADAPAFDEYQSDPARPVPFTGYPQVGMPPQEYVVGDQRFAATRPDVLVYQTPPLEEDLTVAGPIGVRLHVSTTGTDADWVVKLIDVWPTDYPEPAEAEKAPAKPDDKDVAPPRVALGGFQQLVRGEPLRGKFREGLERPVPFVPGQVTPVAFQLPDVLHTFRRGHRVMVQVQSSWFPLVDRNPQTFVDIPSARAEDFQAATHRVHRSAAAPSGLVLRVLPAP